MKRALLVGVSICTILACSVSDGIPGPCIVSVTLFAACTPSTTNPMGYGEAIDFSVNNVMATSPETACDNEVPLVVMEYVAENPGAYVGHIICTADCESVPGTKTTPPRVAQNGEFDESGPSCGPGVCPSGLNGCGGSTGIGGSFGDGVGGSSDVGGVGPVGAGGFTAASSSDAAASVGAGAGETVPRTGSQP
jgi:hypothetical protein